MAHLALVTAFSLGRYDGTGHDVRQNGENTATPEGENTATPFAGIDDSNSMMQLTTEQTAAIRWARVEQAVQHRQPIYDAVNFAVQYFVKRDMLQRWIRALPFGPAPDEAVLLAVWRIHPALPVTYSCDRVLLDDGNWARNLCTYWRVNEDFRVPRVAVTALRSLQDFLVWNPSRYMCWHLRTIDCRTST